MLAEFQAFLKRGTPQEVFCLLQKETPPPDTPRQDTARQDLDGQHETAAYFHHEVHIERRTQLTCLLKAAPGVVETTQVDVMNFESLWSKFEIFETAEGGTRGPAAWTQVKDRPQKFLRPDHCKLSADRRM